MKQSMKTLKGFFLTTACVFCLTVAGTSAVTYGQEMVPTVTSEAFPTITPEAVPTVTPAPQPTAVPKKKGLVKEGKKLCFYYSNGGKAKNKLKTVNGATYYFGPDGYAVCGGVRFKNKNKVYVFGENFKRIKNKKGKIIRVRYSIYYMTGNNGEAATGFFIYKNNLYYGGPGGKLYKNRSLANRYHFTASGAAEKNTDALLKIKTMQIASSITNPGMTKSQKLYACWRYVVGGHIGYWSVYPNLGQAGWQRSLALNTLVNGGGNCYGFACAFAALAQEVGYEPYMVYGYVPGSRDGRADGMTRHCWVQINGLSYDPEGTYAGWAPGIYGTAGYGVYHWTSGSVKFA